MAPARTREYSAGMRAVLDIDRSIMGQPWRWRALAADQREGLVPDDLVTTLLLARGCPREALDAHRAPSIRGFMPDPSTFRDMDKAAARLADAVEAGEGLRSSATMTSTAQRPPRCSCCCCARWGARRGSISRTA